MAKVNRIAYRLEDFPRVEGAVQATWLLDQVSSLRQFLNKTVKQTYDSSFSLWRKMAGSTNKATMTQNQAVKVIFLAAYSKSGKAIVRKKLVDIKSVEVGTTCNQWLTALSARFAAGKATDDDREIFKVLANILEIIPTPKQLEETIEGAKEAGGKSVSLRTMQRDARSEKVRLSMTEPIPVPVLRKVIKRLVQ